jgi:energy-coupling factor transport system ATP-binding protein
MSITIKQVTYMYDAGTPWEIKALDGIDLTIREGRVFGLVGEMGSGKSTLASLMAGLETPTSGRITIDGESPCSGRNVGILFQQPEDFFFEKTLFDDMISGLGNKDITGEEVRRRIHSTLDMLGLDRQILSRSPFHFNRGTLRLAAFASVLLMRPTYLILDEPTASLDPKSRKKVIEVIKTISEEITIIYISHRIQEIAAISDQIAVMEQGKVAFAGTWSGYLNRAAGQNKIASLPILNQLMYEMYKLGFNVDTDVNSQEVAIEQIRQSLKLP